MNDRIKELAKQAGFVLWADEEWKPDGAVIDWSSDYDNDLEKFAELIIRECSLVVFKKTGPKTALDVLEHFGVEAE
jgi:hypothetical protein